MSPFGSHLPLTDVVPRALINDPAAVETAHVLASRNLAIPPVVDTVTLSGGHRSSISTWTQATVLVASKLISETAVRVVRKHVLVGGDEIELVVAHAIEHSGDEIHAPMVDERLVGSNTVLRGQD